ncbi:dihydrodipicolinate synthase family protein [Roseomonas sp. OT10]|uniref:dihydrodipicolinate synthase family protein n=1 Tax=Roseomonas cutis TaxID=2897332 RepID=UPI001E586249|nr:dihydrodipicolinate synthase family protein [Roseomonas sp. OT10]UFN50592.1 dihydrodipicolinate synthase family protein [Roseomonas sp. OT10]
MSDSQQQPPRFGLGCAIATPVQEDGAIDLPRLTAQARWCLDQGCDSLTLFGTTGEGSSFGLAPREAAFAALARAGIPAPERLLAGILAVSEEDVAAQAEQALAAGCRGLLLAPPYYFRETSDDMLFEWFGRVLKPLHGRTKVYLYHIPGMTGVPLSVDLVGRLKSAFPGTVAGVKDSSGDWSNAEALLSTHRDLQLLFGDERLLARAFRLGGSGTICGMANIAPELIGPAVREGRDEPRIAELVGVFLAFPVIPAIKAGIAHRTGEADWVRTRAPLAPLDEAAVRRLGGMLDGLLAARAA